MKFGWGPVLETSLPNWGSQTSEALRDRTAMEVGSFAVNRGFTVIQASNVTLEN